MQPVEMRYYVMYKCGTVVRYAADVIWTRQQLEFHHIDSHQCLGMIVRTGLCVVVVLMGKKSLAKSSRHGQYSNYHASLVQVTKEQLLLLICSRDDLGWMRYCECHHGS